MSWLKIYKGYGKGKTLYNAICDGYERSGNDPPIIQKWIDEQSESYMDKKYDRDRITKLIWKKQSQEHIIFFTKHDIDIEYDEGYNRDSFDDWIKLANESEKKLLISLKESFIEDLNKERCDWAYESACEDYQLFISDITLNDDEDVAQFFGIELNVEGYYNEDNDIELDISDCEFCITCEEPTDKRKTNRQICEEAGVRYDESDNLFICENCLDYYKRDKKHAELNKHIPQDEMIIRMI
jgi:hypothetical protein